MCKCTPKEHIDTGSEGKKMCVCARLQQQHKVLLRGGGETEGENKRENQASNNNPEREHND